MIMNNQIEWIIDWPQCINSRVNYYPWQWATTTNEYQNMVPSRMGQSWLHHQRPKKGYYGQRTTFFFSFLESGQRIKKLMIRGISWGILANNEGVFGLVISITHISVFITHNSKIVGPIVKRLFRKSISLFPELYFHHSILCFLSYELWKLKTHFDCFQFP